MRPSHRGLIHGPLLPPVMLLLIISTTFWGCSSAGSSKPASSTPTTEGPPPATIVLDQLPDLDPFVMWQDYQKDIAAATARYEGNKYHFPNIRVEQMSYLGEGMDLEFYVQSGEVKFRTDRPENIVMVKDGYTVDIVGTVTGMNWNYLNVWMSSIAVVDPPGGGSWSEY